MKVYVTKYALTKGIFTIKAELLDGGNYAREVNAGDYRLFLSRSEYALTAEEAAKQAISKRDARVKSIIKRTKKLQQMAFDIKE